FVGVIRSFGAGKNRAMNTLRVPSHRCESQVRTVTDGPETDLLYTQNFSEILEIVGALIRVVSGQIHTLNVVPVESTVLRVFAQFFYGSFTGRRYVEWQSQSIKTGDIGFRETGSTLVKRNDVGNLAQGH